MSRRLLFLCLLVPLVASSLEGQETNAGTRIGVGVAWSSSNQAIVMEDGRFSPANLVGLGNFTLPILIGDHVRLEPKFGILRSSEDLQDESYSRESRLTVLRVGLSFHWAFSQREGLQPYVGPRVGLMRYRGRSENRYNGQGEEYKYGRNDWYLGLALGGEYFLTRHFSVGAEIQLDYAMVGDESIEPDPGSTREVSGSLLMNNGQIAVRFYF